MGQKPLPMRSRIAPGNQRQFTLRLELQGLGALVVGKSMNKYH